MSHLVLAASCSPKPATRASKYSLGIYLMRARSLTQTLSHLDGPDIKERLLEPPAKHELSEIQWKREKKEKSLKNINLETPWDAANGSNQSALSWRSSLKIRFCPAKQTEHILWWTRSLESCFLYNILCESWRQHRRQRCNTWHIS